MDFGYINHELNNNGYVEIDNFLTLNQVTRIKNFINNKKSLLKNNNFSLANNELEDDVFNEIIYSKEVENLSNNILEKIAPTFNNIEKHVVLGVRDNSLKVKNQSIKQTAFHFDAYFLTINIPITMPEDLKNGTQENQSGDLLLLANFRNFNTSIIKNIVMKFFFQNRFMRYLLSHNKFKNFFNIKRIKLSNSKIYLFYGFRTLHGVDTNFESGERTTFLIHLHNPHSGSFFDKYIKNKHKKQRINSTKN